MTNPRGHLRLVVCVAFGWLGCSSEPGGNGRPDSGNGTAGGTGGEAGASGAGAGGASGGAGATGMGATAGGAAGDHGTAGVGGVSGASGSAGSARGGGGGATAGAAGGGRGGSSGLGGGAGSDACPGAAYDASSPPKALMLTGNLGAHDPAAYVVGKTVYLAATGLGAKTSTVSGGP